LDGMNRINTIHPELQNGLGTIHVTSPVVSLRVSPSLSALRACLCRKARRGFTLVEMLVVIAITIVLMGLLLGPLSQSFKLTARGRAMIAAQDNARSAMVQISRDLQDAMAVYDGLPVVMYTYTPYQVLNGRPHPDNTSQPSLVTYPGTTQPVEYRNAMIDMVLPKARYYCTGFDHYLTDQEVAPNQAVEFCPRPGHENSPVEARPIEPLQPSGTRVRYFIGLRLGYNPSPIDPTVPGASSNLPHYMNPLLFTMSASEFNNPYVLYRVEFNPGDPAVANWRLPNGQINPNFWYDPKYAAEWKSRAVAVITPLNTDMVRWLQDPGNPQSWMPQPLTRFGATAIESETLDPNRETLSPDGQGGLKAAALAPMQYVADYGHMTGPSNDMTLPLAPSIVMGPANPGTPGFVLGPRIQIYDAQPGASGNPLVPVYDSAVPVGQVPRRRLFTWDSTRGIVNFALRAETTQAVQAQGGGAPGEVPYSFSLLRDKQTRDLPLVSNPTQTQVIAAGFGSLKADPLLGDTVRIVPGSELVQAVDGSGQPIRTFERAGWIGAGRDQIVAQADLDPDQYAIDYTTGLIMFSDREPNLAGQQVHVQYQMHTNKSTDVVRMSYSTRELLSIDVGVEQFEPGSGEAQEIQISNRLRLRNLTH
jgi:prepilin-type N-terminal cleavage/methylation domain-containing protein